MKSYLEKLAHGFMTLPSQDQPKDFGTGLTKDGQTKISDEVVHTSEFSFFQWRLFPAPKRAADLN
jgi:hypothetical protein